MVFRISGVNLPDNKNIDIALSYLYGIGRSAAIKLLSEQNVSPLIKVKDLTADQMEKIRRAVEKEFKVEGDLRRDIMLNIKRLKEIGSYKGDRHKRNLPVRGQRTKTNARTKRGKRVTVGSGRKEAPGPK